MARHFVTPSASAGREIPAKSGPLHISEGQVTAGASMRRGWPAQRSPDDRARTAPGRRACRNPLRVLPDGPPRSGPPACGPVSCPAAGCPRPDGTVPARGCQTGGIPRQWSGRGGDRWRRRSRRHPLSLQNAQQEQPSAPQKALWSRTGASALAQACACPCTPQAVPQPQALASRMSVPPPCAASARSRGW